MSGAPRRSSPQVADEADERSRSERAAAEAEDVELVSLLQGSGVLEVLDQPVVCGADVGLEAEAESTARDLVERSGADAFEIELELSDRVCVERVVSTFSGQTKVMQHVGRIVSIVPGAIETQRQSPDRLSLTDAGLHTDPLLNELTSVIVNGGGRSYRTRRVRF